MFFFTFMRISESLLAALQKSPHPDSSILHFYFCHKHCVLPRYLRIRWPPLQQADNVTPQKSQNLKINIHARILLTH